MKLLVHTHTSTRESMISHPHNLFTSQMKEEGIEGERREGRKRESRGRESPPPS